MKRFSPNKDYNQFCNEMAEQGWSISKTNGGHLKWQHPSGANLHSAQTPSCNRAIENTRRDIRRAFAKAGVPVQERDAFQQQMYERKLRLREERAKENLTFRLPIPHSKEPVVNLSQPSPIHKEKIFLKTAHSKMLELMANGKSPADAAEVVHQVFMVVAPISQNSAVSKERLLAIANNRTWGARGKNKAKEAKEEVAPPPTPIPLPSNPPPLAAQAPKEPRASIRKKSEVVAKLSPEDIDEKLRHVRAVIDMPFDKNKKLEIIIDLLHAML